MPQPQLDLENVEYMAANYMKSTSTGSKLLQNQILSSKKKNKKRFLFPSETKWNSHPLLGATIVITGCTSGIGKSIATTAHGLGATIVALGRSSKKLSELKVELEANTKVPNGRIMTILADLSDLESVAKAADEIKKKTKSIDILVNNAGIHYKMDVYNLYLDPIRTKQGYDLTFGVNYLSHFLLTAKLLPQLEKSKLQPKIIQISSSFHFMVDGSELQVQPNESAPLASRSDVQTFVHKNRSYANSKLAQIYHMRALSRRLEETNSPVKVVSICPGWVNTNIAGGFLDPLERIGVFAVDGVGISSSLNGMFLPHLGGVDEPDYLAQTPFRLDFPQRPKALVQSKVWNYFRDWFVSSIGAGSLMILQKYLFSKTMVINSSTESYHEDKQESLYKWSEKEVSFYL